MHDEPPVCPGGPQRREKDAAQGAGVLVLVAGPSGAGKDTLLDAARAHFASDARIHFCRRVITRTDTTGEAHVSVSVDEFQRMASAGELFLNWEAHGLFYGIGMDALDALRGGRTAVANVSRGIIAEARQRWPRTHVIQVTARAEALSMRLAARGRETTDGIGQRLKRAGELPLPAAEWLSEVDNSGDLAEAVARFNALLIQAANA